MRKNKSQDIGNDTELYPDGCTGWLWITSPGTAGEIAQAAKVVKFFWIDDVWITGYIARHLKIEHQVNYKSLQNEISPYMTLLLFFQMNFLMLS